MATIAENLKTIAENVPNVHKSGKDAEWNAFWDNFQNNGARRSYNFGFINSDACWNKNNFKPKYDIIMVGNASNAFYTWQGLPESVDIGAILKAQGITIDTSQATNVQNLFAYGTSIVGSLPTFDFTSAATTTGAFRSVKVHTIDKLIINETTNFGTMFRDCTELENIVIEGTIANGALDLRQSTKLSADSLKSVINALSASASGLTVTLPTTAEANYNAKYGAGAWATLIASKSNWSIAYA